MSVLESCVCICVCTHNLHMVSPIVTKWAFKRKQSYIFNPPGGKTLKMAGYGGQKPVEQSSGILEKLF